MHAFSNLNASPLFWEAFWPVVAFASLAILCLISLAWFSRCDRDAQPWKL